jgi:hypothetical protein
MSLARSRVPSFASSSLAGPGSDRRIPTSVLHHPDRITPQPATASGFACVQLEVTEALFNYFFFVIPSSGSVSSPWFACAFNEAATAV